jgi:PAS domain S-box-containing protein
MQIILSLFFYQKQFINFKKAMNTELRDEFFELVKKDNSIINFLQLSGLDGLWYLDLEDRNRDWFDEKFWKTFGYDFEEAISNNLSWIDIIDKDDLEKASDLLYKHVENPNIPYDLEVKYYHKSGQPVWIRCRGMAIRNSKGKAIRMLGVHSDITNLKNYEKNLEKELSVFNSIIHTTGIGTWNWNLLTDEIKLNDAFLNSAGLDKSIYKKVPLSKFKKIIIHPKIDEFIEDKKNSFKQKTDDQLNITFKILSSKGKTLWFEARGLLTERCNNGTPLNAAGTLIEVTQLIESQNELQNKIELKKIINFTTSELINVTNENIDNTLNFALKRIGEFAKIDRSYIFRLFENDEILENTHEWCADGVAPEIENLKNLPADLFHYTLNDLKKLKSFYFENINDIPDEYTKDFLAEQNIKSILIVPLHKDNVLLGFMGFDSVEKYKKWEQFDIDVLKSFAHIVGNSIVSAHTQKELIEAKNRAQESDRLKSAFLATINHELRTPLNHILGFAEIIKDSAENTDIVHFASIIKDSGSNLLSIVEDIFDLALTQSKEVKIRNENIKLLDFYLELKESLREVLEKYGKSEMVRLVFKPDTSNLRSYIETDKYKISQVLLNLFKNAVKFTDKGEIEFGFKRNEKNILFWVKDTGIGIPEDKKSFIFEFFRQVDDTDTRKHGGLGIGLAISKKIAEVLGAEIILNSELGKGSEFLFNIPIKQQEDVFASINLDTSDKKIYDFSGLTILIAEDDTESMNLINFIFQETKATILNARNGLEAIDIFMENKKGIDLILMDLKMPVLDGFEAIKSIKKLNPNQLIVALTAYSLKSDKELALSIGCSDIINKPLDKELMFAKIDNLVIKTKLD